MKPRSKGQVLATRARQALENGELEEAQKLARKAMLEAPDDPAVLRSLAEFVASAGHMDDACRLLEKACAVESTAPVSWFVRLGDWRVRQGKLDDAVRAYQTALSTGPDEKGAWAGLAEARDAQRNTHGAIEALERVVEIDPSDWEAANSLAEAWMEIREFERAEKALDTAAKGKADRPAILVSRGNLELQRGRQDAAIATLKDCVARHPAYAPGHAALGSAFRVLGRFEEATLALARAKELAPDDHNYPLVLGRALLEGGHAERAFAEAREYLARRPGHSGALALEALSCLARGDSEGAARFFDYPNVVSATKLAVPAGYADLATFNAALASHAATHPTLMASPASHSTVDGYHSGSILVDPRGPVAPFEEAIEGAIGAYWERLSTSKTAPFAAHRPRDVVMAMWCIVLAPGTHQGPHIHPAAWLSGVYYPQIPEGVRTGSGPAGWLEFGEPDRTFPTKIEPPRYKVRPEEGLVVIFPSYLYHRTLPFDDPGKSHPFGCSAAAPTGEDSGTRISVAFDVVPL